MFTTNKHVWIPLASGADNLPQLILLLPMLPMPWYVGVMPFWKQTSCESLEMGWINQVQWLMVLIDGEDTITFFAEQLHHVITEETV